LDFPLFLLDWILIRTKYLTTNNALKWYFKLLEIELINQIYLSIYVEFGDLLVYYSFLAGEAQTYLLMVLMSMLFSESLLLHGRTYAYLLAIPNTLTTRK
jgi:hypothetical protein